MAKRLLGSGSKGRTRNARFRAGGTYPGTINMNDPSQSGDPDVVQQRAAQAGKGRMLSKQLKKNKSTGLRIKSR